MTADQKQMPKVIYAGPLGYDAPNNKGQYTDSETAYGGTTKYIRADLVEARAAQPPSEDERLKELSAQLVDRGYVDVKFYDGVRKRDAIEMIEAILAGKTNPFTPFGDSTHQPPSDKERANIIERLFEDVQKGLSNKSTGGERAIAYSSLSRIKVSVLTAPDHTETIKALVKEADKIKKANKYNAELDGLKDETKIEYNRGCFDTAVKLLTAAKNVGGA